MKDRIIKSTNDLIHVAILKLQLALGYAAKGDQETVDELALDANKLYERWREIVSNDNRPG